VVEGQTLDTGSLLEGDKDCRLEVGDKDCHLEVVGRGCHLEVVGMRGLECRWEVLGRPLEGLEGRVGALSSPQVWVAADSV